MVVPVDALDDRDLELVAGPPGPVEGDELGFEPAVQRPSHRVGAPTCQEFGRFKLQAAFGELDACLVVGDQAL